MSIAKKLYVKYVEDKLNALTKSNKRYKAIVVDDIVMMRDLVLGLTVGCFPIYESSDALILNEHARLTALELFNIIKEQ